MQLKHETEVVIVFSSLYCSIYMLEISWKVQYTVPFQLLAVNITFFTFKVTN